MQMKRVLRLGDKPDQNHSEEQVDREGGPVGENNDVLEDPDHFTGQKSVIMILKTVSHQDCHTIGRAGQSWRHTTQLCSTL